MPRGRQPEGDHALSDAERQARYRARRQAEQTPSRVRYRRPADRRARPQRWHDAVAELLALQAEYAAWCDALPNSLRDSATAEALQAILELDLDVLADIEPPRGFGRDRCVTKRGFSIGTFGEISIGIDNPLQATPPARPRRGPLVEV